MLFLALPSCFRLRCSGPWVNWRLPPGRHRERPARAGPAHDRCEAASADGARPCVRASPGSSAGSTSTHNRAARQRRGNGRRRSPTHCPGGVRRPERPAGRPAGPAVIAPHTIASPRRRWSRHLDGVVLAGRSAEVGQAAPLLVRAVTEGYPCAGRLHSPRAPTPTTASESRRAISRIRMSGSPLPVGSIWGCRPPWPRRHTASSASQCRCEKVQGEQSGGPGNAGIDATSAPCRVRAEGRGPRPASRRRRRCGGRGGATRPGCESTTRSGSPGPGAGSVR